VPIRILSANVAAAIAAGEVIERPASVVKELIENSLDAAATSITIELQQGGIGSIRVTDDGSGIPQSEIELAFARHATSKLTEADDLRYIASLGFRGEALPSIAAAGKVRMVSRPANAQSAGSVELEGSKVLRRQTLSAAPGTSISVDDLFVVLPARRKFLRTPMAEGARVKNVVAHMAMAYPLVHFSFYSDDRLMLQTPGSGAARDVLAVVYGADAAAVMLDIRPGERSPYEASGLISPATLSRASRSAISLFVNGRWVQSRSLSIAAEEAYRGYLTQGRYPVVALFLQVPLAEVDVNVHPTKREVRFLREGDAFSTVQRAVRETLLATSPIALISAPELIGGHVKSMTTNLSLNSVEPGSQPTLIAQAPSESGSAIDLPVEKFRMPSLRVVGQISNTYVVAEGADGLYLVDQHAAHEQVLFERLIEQWGVATPQSQPLLDPYPLELTPEETEAVEGALPVLQRFGFLLEPFGGAWLVRAVPMVGRPIALAPFIKEMLTVVRDKSMPMGPPERALAASIACHSSVRAGMALDIQEMEALLEQLEKADNPRHCPHGRPTTIHMSTGMLDRQFHRT
jgi:DNA mismatch repair protein MutL